MIFDTRICQSIVDIYYICKCIQIILPNEDMYVGIFSEHRKIVARLQIADLNQLLVYFTWCCI